MTAIQYARPGDVPAEAERFFRPIGGARALFSARDKEVMLSGPAGTGKSRGCLEKMYAAAQKYPRSRHLIVRKTRESLTEAALVTFEEKVIPPHLAWASNQQRRVRQSYVLPNKSVIVVGGLDKADKVMSTEYDTIYVQEARELLEDDWEKLTTRLRNGVMPYQQIHGDTNPDAPSHWLKQRANRGVLRLLESRHEDNPTVTPEYLATLDALTGVRYKRLRLGLWVAAENMVYEGWDPAVHLIDRRDIPPEWTRFRAVDFGFTNPFVCQWWAEDPDGRLYRYRELYAPGRTVKDWAHQIALHSRGEHIEGTVTDHDVEGRADLEAHMGHTDDQCDPYTESEPATLGIQMTTAARKDVNQGIDAVAERLKRAGDGKARIFLLRDSLVERDAGLEERKRPTCTEEEIESYVWDHASSQKYGDVILEQPLKKDDHGLDAMRYAVMYIEDPMRRYAQAFGKSGTVGPERATKPGADPRANARHPIRDLKQLDDVAAYIGRRRGR